MTSFTPAETLRTHRALLLAMESVGWLHMTGKCRAAFLRERGGQSTGYDDLRWHEHETPPFPWNSLLDWVKTQYANINGHTACWPGSLTEFLTKHRERNAGLLALLQAGHAMASGIEKQSVPDKVIKYLGQDATHLWLSSAFGCPSRNLLVDPLEALSDTGWAKLLDEIRRVLQDLQQRSSAGGSDLESWWNWRQSAIGPESVLRAAFGSTLAETRLPNNDVTLWDQSYVAAALFKSALAGAVLQGTSFPWTDGAIKNKVQWRLLTVGIGADHFEARAVRIGDWTGARLALDRFFAKVRRLIEVDVAAGSLLYNDGSTAVFSFPGERSDGTGTMDESGWQAWIQDAVDALGAGLNLELPPIVRISKPTRSLVPMTAEIADIRRVLAMPVHRDWSVTGSDPGGHVCPVCLVRLNGAPNDKQKPCKPCRDRRIYRLNAWLDGSFGNDTIWISEVADQHDRLALVTLSLDLGPWLDGRQIDSLRTQAISEWRRHNPVLGTTANPIDASHPASSLLRYIESFVCQPRTDSQGRLDDRVLASLQEGFRRETSLQEFFQKIVEDRADAPNWDSLKGEVKARWLVHQLFRKLASPGRVYRFWRQAEEFFIGLLRDFREMAAVEANRWRVRRLILSPDSTFDPSKWNDREVYNGRLGDGPVSLLYREQTKDFLTACNLARLLRPDQDGASLVGHEIGQLRGDDLPQALSFFVAAAGDADGMLGIYYPVIPLEVSPLRFRAILPLSAASDCIERAIASWNEEMGRVWDRLPLRAGIVAFPRMVPFQAVVESARNIEHALEEGPQEETWRIAERNERDGVVALSLARPDGGNELCTVPVVLPDGRRDMFYPYLRVEERGTRAVLDFQHPDGQTYRHALDLRPGDGIIVAPSRIASVFLDSSARRFDEIDARPLADWERMRSTWQLVNRTAPGQTALRGAWAELVERRESWHDPDGAWLEGGRNAWLALVRSVFHARLGARGAALDHIVEAAGDGILGWAIEWHVGVLKEHVQEATYG